jgi:ferredoxin
MFGEIVPVGVAASQPVVHTSRTRTHHGKAISGVKAVIDGSKCQGHGRCSLIVPTVFDVDDYGNGMVLVDEVPEEEQEDVREAVLCCPENAISVVE